MKISILFFCYIVLLGACASEEDAKISKALELARTNRGELEKVLQHYATEPTDSLKLKAARFLIANMPGHYTLGGEKMESYRKKIYADSSVSYRSKKELEISLGLMEEKIENIQKLPDVECLSSAFLIHHIEACFERKEQYAWLQDITFDIFLEYILPYRLLYEKPDYWRDSLLVIPEHRAKNLFTTGGMSSFAYFMHVLEVQENGLHKLDLIPELLTEKQMYSDCRMLCYCNLFEARAKGIPVGVDFIPHYSNRNGYHYWLMNAPLLTKNYYIENAFDRRTAKVYRRTFSCNPVPEPASGEYIPSFFLDPFNKDVTDLYFYTQDIQVPIQKSIPNSKHHAYLSVFNNLSWKPIAIGSFKGEKAVFTDVCRNVAYLPVVYQQENEQTFNYPFLLCLDHSVRQLVPDTNHLQKMRLFRKNSAREGLQVYHERLAGTVIEASADRNFKQADTIFRLEKSLPGYYYSVVNENPRPYRYFRIIPQKKTVYISELIFYNADGQQVKGYVDSLYKRMTDNDILTHVTLQRDSVLFIQLDEPVHIQRTVCLPRSDGNGIYPGHVYELLYHDLEGWCSLGEKVATDFSIEYDNVPSGALYWLRNLSGGVEERIFTWENGAQQFW